MPQGFSAQSFFAADGVAINPAYNFNSEISLGLYRSGTSTVALSYGTFIAPISAASIVRVGTLGRLEQTTVFTQLVDGNGFGRVLLATSAGDNGHSYMDLGNNVNAAFIFRDSADATVFSASSSKLTSVVTLQAPTVLVTSGISIGNASAGVGSLIRAISSMSSLVAAFVVQPSASSFTVVTWAAAQPGDQILTTVMQSGAVSSLSSGLVLHSHCTQAGQIEFRLSNVSTLAQNQSSRSYFFTRITPF